MPMLIDMLPPVEQRALHALANRKAPMPSADQAMTTRAMLRQVHRSAMARRNALAELGISEDLVTRTQRDTRTGRFTSPVRY